MLGIPVDDDQLERWGDYWAPEHRPFPRSDVPRGIGKDLGEGDLEHPDEWRDTFFLYRGGPWTWLSEEVYTALSPDVRRSLATGLRRRTGPKPTLAWPSDPMLIPRLVRWIEAGTKPSLHALATKELRAASKKTLPGAASIAGSFPNGSGPNCFGTVMAAAGQQVSEEWVGLDQFEGWLARLTEPVEGSRFDGAAGVVLVWHEQGTLAHAAVTLGGGWALQKPSQSWSSPVLVQPVTEIIRAWTYPGAVLSRHLLSGAT